MLTHRRILVLLTASCVAVPSLLACGSSNAGSNNAPNATVPAAGNSEESHEGKFTRTVVVLNENGTQTVHFSWITRAEQLEEQAQREAARNGLTDGADQPLSLTQDTGCTLAADIILFDEAGMTGDELCLYNANSTGSHADLANYTRDTTYCYTTNSYISNPWNGIQYIGCAEIENQHGLDDGDQVQSIEGFADTPGGCFSTSNEGTNYTSSSDYWNFSYQSGGTNTGSTVYGFRYLWLAGPGNDTSSLCQTVL
jgi:hypothetical protein